MSTHKNSGWIKDNSTIHGPLFAKTVSSSINGLFLGMFLHGWLLFCLLDWFFVFVFSHWQMLFLPINVASTLLYLKGGGCRSETATASQQPKHWTHRRFTLHSDLKTAAREFKLGHRRKHLIKVICNCSVLLSVCFPAAYCMFWLTVFKTSLAGPLITLYIIFIVKCLDCSKKGEGALCV